MHRRRTVHFGQEVGLRNGAAFKHPSFASEREFRLVVSPFISNEFAVQPKYHVTPNRIKKYYR